MKQLLSKSSMYGVHILVHLATADSSRPLQLKEIAKALNVSRDSLAKIIRTLSRAGLLHVYRGRDGGCRLRRSPEQITVLQAIEAVDGRFETGDPLLNSPERRQIGLRLMKALRPAVEEMKERLNRTTIAAMALNAQQLNISERRMILDQNETILRSGLGGRFRGSGWTTRDIK